MTNATERLSKRVRAVMGDRNNDELPVTQCVFNVRKEAESLQAECEKLVETLTTIRTMFPAKIDKHSFVVNGGPPLRVNDDDEFYGAKKVNALVDAIVSTIDGALSTHRKGSRL